MRYFKCVKHYPNSHYTNDFTIGTIYKCNNIGQLIDNHGFGWGWLNSANEAPNRRVDNFIEYNKNEVKFIEVQSPPKITVKVDGRKTIACMWVNGKLVKKRFCVCHADDEYDYAKGVEIAVKRLFDWNYERQIKVPTFIIGDKVEIINNADAHPTAYDWIDDNCPEYASRFAYGYTPKKNEFGIVVFADVKNNLYVVKLASTDRTERHILINGMGLSKL